MSSHRLSNYLKTYRKSMGLSQTEVARLLGCSSGAKVSRYERFIRQPSLETVFAFEVVFGAPGRELFAGMFERVWRKTIRRSRAMVIRLSKSSMDQRTVYKLKALRAIILPAGANRDHFS